MRHACEKCDGEVKYGEPSVQMRTGRWYGAITPASRSFELLAEWHHACFHEFDLKAQRLPYRSEECRGEIEPGQEISFFVKGRATDESSSFAERRGYELHTVKHYPECPRPS